MISSTRTNFASSFPARLTLYLLLCFSLASCSSFQFERIYAVAEEDSHPYIHTVSMPGENLSTIAEWYTGKAANWVAIQKANPRIRPHALQLGDQITIPSQILTRRGALPAQRVLRNQSTTVQTAPRSSSDLSASVQGEVNAFEFLLGENKGSDNPGSKSMEHNKKRGDGFPEQRATDNREQAQKQGAVVVASTEEPQQGEQLEEEDLERQRLLRELLNED